MVRVKFNNVELDIGLPDIVCKAYCDDATRERILVAEFDYLLNRNYANGL